MEADRNVVFFKKLDDRQNKKKNCESSLYPDMFHLDTAIFNRCTPRLKPSKVNWITFINFIAFTTYSAECIEG
jgi:hypothetical protein